MNRETNPLVLEVFRHETALEMSVSRRAELSSTLRNYSQVSVSYLEIDKLCREIISLLNRADKFGRLDDNGFDSLKKTAGVLWGHLLAKPVKDRLRREEGGDLLLALDEGLIGIPWELLYDGENFLSLKFNLGRVVRTKARGSEVQYRSLGAIPKMLILANPTNDLKSAYLEGAFIKNQFDRRRRQIHIDFKSTQIDTLYVKKNLRDYDIVHFAGHCEYERGQDNDTGWVLNDGKFSAKDVYTLGETQSLPSLVFSNACHSAGPCGDFLDMGSQKKAFNLAAAFLFSGVRHYIGAIRRIEDSSSLAFAKDFYHHLISGRPVGECMRLARLKLVRDCGAHSVPWAGYILYGDPNFTLFKSRHKLPETKPGKTFRYKKRLIWVAFGAFFILLATYLYMWLPTLNPNTYMLFLKARQAFLKGKNQEVISLSAKIIRQDPVFLAVYPQLADTFHRLGDKENTLKYYYAYINSSEKKQDKKHLVAAYNGIGWSYLLQGDYPKAYDFFQKAMDLSRRNNDRLGEARALERLAVWYTDKRNFDKALELLTRSSQINLERQNDPEHKYGLACDYFDLAIVYTEKQDLNTAKEFYQKSRRLFEKLKMRHELSDYYFNLGEISLFEKQYQQALELYMKGLKIDQDEAHKPNLASDYYMIGELYLEMDNLVEAENYFNQAVELSKEINALPELATAYYDLAKLYQKKGRRNMSREYFRQAQEIYHSVNPAMYEKIKKELLGLDGGRD